MDRKVFLTFVDFVISLIDKDKVTVRQTDSLTSFRIVLLDTEGVNKRLEVSIYYLSGGTFIGAPTPIERFKFELVQGVISIFSTSSNDGESYDKLLELFKSIINYMKKRNNKYNNPVLQDILERKNWKKTQEEIKQEIDESLDIKLGEEDLQRKRELALNKLILKYRHQGYEIIK